MRYLLDTNACIDIIKRRSERLYTRFQGLRIGEVCISALTPCELQFCVARSLTEMNVRCQRFWDRWKCSTFRRTQALSTENCGRPCYAMARLSGTSTC